MEPRLIRNAYLKAHLDAIRFGKLIISPVRQNPTRHVAQGVQSDGAARMKDSMQVKRVISSQSSGLRFWSRPVHECMVEMAVRLFQSDGIW